MCRMVPVHACFVTGTGVHSTPVHGFCDRDVNNRSKRYSTVYKRRGLILAHNRIIAIHDRSVYGGCTYSLRTEGLSSSTLENIDLAIYCACTLHIHGTCYALFCYKIPDFIDCFHRHCKHASARPCVCRALCRVLC